MATSEWRVVEEADLNGSYLRCELLGLAVQDVRFVFGPARPDAYYEPERGYDGDEWVFEDCDGQVVNVYTRWGALRVGARGEVSDLYLDGFLSWLREQVRAARM